MASRQEIINHYKADGNVDVLVIGGGINGVGTYRDLAIQGINVLLVESDDFSSGASAASSHMVHGGIRYLENGEFRLVREAVHERELLLRNAPHAVKKLPTTIPIFRWFSGLFNAPLKFLKLLDKPAERGFIVIKFGLMMYDSFTGKSRRTLPHKIAWKKETLNKWPAINAEILCTATYYDAYMPYPERISVEIILDAEKDQDKAHALNYMRVTSASGDRVNLRDEVTGETFSVTPKVVVNAGGPWIDAINQALGVETSYMGGTKGSHLIIDHPELRETIGDNEFFFENKDGRIVLILPFFDRVIVGTSDIAIEDPDTARCTEAEIDYFIGMIERVFPSYKIERSQIVFTFSGVRPLPAVNAKSTGQITRDHSVEEISEDHERKFPIYSLVGGKWTTFRAFGEQVSDIVLRRMGKRRERSTYEMPIGGGKEYPQTEQKCNEWLSDLSKLSSLPIDRLSELFDRYGTLCKPMAEWISLSKDELLKNSTEYTIREIQYLVKEEKTVHLDDLALRRTSLGMRGMLTRELAQELASIMGAAIGWDKNQQDMEVERLGSILEDRNRVKLK